MNEQTLNTLIGKFLNDLGAAFTVPLARIGDDLGIYTAMKENGPSTPAELAKKAGLHERYLREWLSAQAASDYVSYDPAAGKFFLSEEQAFILASPDSPVHMTPAFSVAAAAHGNYEKVRDGFRTGAGVAWGDQTQCLACATARFFRPGYLNNLTASWIPALDGVGDKLKAGATVADVGCGHGISTLIMAEAYPNSSFTGFDFHEPSIEAAREHATRHGTRNLKFSSTRARELPGTYDFVTLFDCLHDMGDPVAAMTSIREALKPGGTCMIVEPMAGDTLTDNLNPVGRLFYSASTMICVPTSLAQETKTALGAQAGEKRLREVIVDGAGFKSFRRATETPFNLILEAKP